MLLRLRIVPVAALVGVLVACGGYTDSRSRTSATTEPDTATTAPETTPPTPATGGSVAPCDRAQALAAVLASGGAVGGGHIDYLKCLDGFGWALYRLQMGMGYESAHVILSISADGYEVLNLGTSVCPLDAGVPADVALAIAPSPLAATDCPEDAPSDGDPPNDSALATPDN